MFSMVWRGLEAPGNALGKQILEIFGSGWAGWSGGTGNIAWIGFSGRQKKPFYN